MTERLLLRLAMNSNAVYGAPVCGHGSTVDYSQNCYPHHELSYYNHSAAELSSASQAGQGSAAAYVPSSLHMGHPTSQFLEPALSETNGLSYTNLDANGYPTSAASKLGHFSPNENQRQQTLSAMSGSVISSAASHQSYSSSSHNSQYRDFSSVETSVPSSHPELSSLSDCAVMRSSVVPGSVPSSAQYPYLEPGLLPRRNGNLSYGGEAFDISCSQLNGSAYHLNHLSHLHVSPHHHHHHHPNGRTNSVSAAAPVPTYKWMQVKRNVPKPGEYTSLVSVSISGRHSCSHLSHIRHEESVSKKCVLKGSAGES